MLKLAMVGEANCAKKTCGGKSGSGCGIINMCIAYIAYSAGTICIDRKTGNSERCYGTCCYNLDSDDLLIRQPWRRIARVLGSG